VSDELRAAVAAGVLGSEEQFQALLQSIVDVARAIFKAKASSIFLLDEEADELSSKRLPAKDPTRSSASAFRPARESPASSSSAGSRS
jgi:hypothetical protein